MSGGHWEYTNDGLARMIFGWTVDVNYGEKGFSQSKIAARIDPLEDREMSEMLWDMLCVLHSFDWYKSDDTSEDTYREDVKRFKEKWLNVTAEERVRRAVEDGCQELRNEIYRMFGVSE